MITRVDFRVEETGWSYFAFTYYIGSERQSELVEFDSASVTIEQMAKAYAIVTDFKSENGIR